MNHSKRILVSLLAVTAFAWSQKPSAPVSRPAPESRPERRNGRADRPKAKDAVSTLVGKPAPEFNLARADGKGRVKLSTYKNDRPVLLVFGSWS